MGHNFHLMLSLCSKEVTFPYIMKLGNGEHLSFEAYKYKENNIYVIIIYVTQRTCKLLPRNIFYRHNLSRYEVMAYKRRWRRSAITCIAGGSCERISMQWGCKVAEFWFVNYFFICGKNSGCFILIYNWPSRSRIIKG